VSSSGNDYWAKIDDTLAGRKAGGSASAKARELRAAHPVRTLAEQALGHKTDARAWRKGARGERFTGWLPEGWHVFNDVPIGVLGANIDHVVVGPGGVFTVNTKNRSGKVWLAPRTLLVNGIKTDYLPKAVCEAARATDLVSSALGRTVPIHAVLAIVADDWAIKDQPSDVYVGGPRSVKRWFLEQPTTLTPREVNEVAAVCAKPSTWAG
jgi:Nuclease-related domain